MILFKNVQIPQAEKWLKSDILIEHGRFEELSPNIDRSIVKKGEVVDAEGGFLLPALIDPHVHVREPGFDHKENWETCSKAALKGGFCTIFDMPNNKVPVVDSITLLEKKKIALKKSYVDFGLYIALTDENIEEIMKEEVQCEICGVKVYLAHTTGGLIVKSENALLNVFRQPKPVLIHTGGVQGLERILYFYEKASIQVPSLPILYICHVSTDEEVKLIKKYKKKFPNIFAEATPHHLFLNKSNYTHYNSVLPHLAQIEDSESLWNGIAEGVLNVIGTDHAPHTLDEKKGKNPPSGFPGLETALPLLFEACLDGRIKPTDLLHLTSITARSLFGIGEGEILKGRRADCVLLKEGNFLIGEDGYVTKCGWSPFNGRKIKYRPVMTITGGTTAYRSGKFYKRDISFLTMHSIKR
ncbi:MAG: dihydroorotase family protein [Spirochaetota bacterium]|nr:MAG: dihydroorotase family protein [Spirochaetota bacterium]